MKNLINAKLLNNLWRDGISPLKNSLADKLGVARVLKTTEEFEANTDENNIPSATLMKVKLNSLDSKIQSFEDTKSEIASSGLGVALGLAISNTWAQIVAKLKTVVNRGAVNATISTSGGSYTIPKGFHNGSGKVTGPSLSNLIGTDVSLTDMASLLNGVTAYGKNGIKYTGTMENKGNYSKWFTPSSSQQSVSLPAGYYTGGTIGCYAQGSSFTMPSGGLAVSAGTFTTSEYYSTLLFVLYGSTSSTAVSSTSISTSLHKLFDGRQNLHLFVFRNVPSGTAFTVKHSNGSCYAVYWK